MAVAIDNLTDDTFDEVVGASDKPVLVDFWEDDLSHSRGDRD